MIVDFAKAEKLLIFLSVLASHAGRLTTCSLRRPPFRFINRRLNSKARGARCCLPQDGCTTVRMDELWPIQISQAQITHAITRRTHRTSRGFMATCQSLTRVYIQDTQYYIAAPTPTPPLAGNVRTGVVYKTDCRVRFLCLESS